MTRTLPSAPEFLTDARAREAVANVVVAVQAIGGATDFDSLVAALTEVASLAGHAKSSMMDAKRAAQPVSTEYRVRVRSGTKDNGQRVVITLEQARGDAWRAMDVATTVLPPHASVADAQHDFVSIARILAERHRLGDLNIPVVY